ncbi:MAG: phosphatidylglycerophosphatase A [Rhodospirillaceae bacterium]|nr:phosphatidylglycerophosphatase A [Rhodospirillaceae bacterium]MBT7953585.1 phosphatidylglycerophosphatase A [Rhodospirillaceae bacterium]
MNRIAYLIAIWFGAGLLPKAPGTWGSLAALPLAYGIVFWGSLEVLAAATVVIFIVGVWASEIAAGNMGGGDPSEIVVDEVAGQWLTLLVVPPDIILYAAGFLLFRLFDIWKPWPISWADQKIKGGMGIMLDDMIAGVYAGVLLWIGQFVYVNYLAG